MFKDDEVKMYGHKTAVCTPAPDNDKNGRFTLGRRKNQESIPRNIRAFQMALKKISLA